MSRILYISAATMTEITWKF